MTEKFINILTKVDLENDMFSISFVKSNKEDIISNSFKSFKVVDIKLSDLISSKQFEGEKIVGEAILSLCRRLIDKKYVNNISLNSQNESQKEVAELLREKADDGNQEAQFELATFYMNISVDNCDKSLLYEAEELLKESSQNGYIEAKRFLRDTWPTLKKTYLKLIDKKSR